MIRFRRLSTVIVFLLLSGFAYVWVPASASGRTLMQIAGARVLYNSAAIGMGTSMLASMFIGLFGFYVVSNAVRRDVNSRCGYVIASTTMRTGEYIIGKFLGNVVFLTTFIGGYMAASMAMLLVRGEAPLQPLIFIKQYAIVTPSTIVFISVAAIVFESVPWLSGRFGDVLYFFVYAASLGIAASSMDRGGGGVLRFFDVSSFGYIAEQCRALFHTTSMTIGSSRFDPSKAPVTIEGLNLAGDAWATRLISTIAPIPFLLVARVFFHRFDPARIRAAGAKGKRGWTRGFNALAKPFARLLAMIPVRGAALIDARMTFATAPFAGVALIGIAIATLFNVKTLPISVAVAAVFIADIASRDRRAGTTALISASPRLRENMVVWKFASSSIVAAILLIVPIVRNPSIIVATLVIAAAATSLAVISGNPKTFIVLFLTFWYVVVNDAGKTKALDFAGFYGTPAIGVMAMYVGIAIAFIIAAAITHRTRLSS